jgi:hypothetical protein
MVTNAKFWPVEWAFLLAPITSRIIPPYKILLFPPSSIALYSNSKYFNEKNKNWIAKNYSPFLLMLVHHKWSVQQTYSMYIMPSSFPYCYGRRHRLIHQSIFPWPMMSPLAAAESQLKAQISTRKIRRKKLLPSRDGISAKLWAKMEEG